MKVQEVCKMKMGIEENIEMSLLNGVLNVPTCSTCPRALRAHVPKYILQTGKLKNGNFVPIRF